MTTVPMWPPGGGVPVHVQPASVETMRRRGWLDKSPAAKPVLRTESPEPKNPETKTKDD